MLDSRKNERLIRVFHVTPFALVAFVLLLSEVADKVVSCLQAFSAFSFAF